MDVGEVSIQVPKCPDASDEIEARIRQGVDELIGFVRNDSGSLRFGLGYRISDQTVGNILKEHGIEPVPNRKRQTTWKTFIKAHWDCLAAIEFTTDEGRAGDVLPAVRDGTVYPTCSPCRLHGFPWWRIYETNRTKLDRSVRRVLDRQAIRLDGP